jgi:hypothetical protein
MFNKNKFLLFPNVSIVVKKILSTYYCNSQ